MTLINYLSRVHFSDGVLEVALTSELELYNLTRPVLVWEKEAVSAEFTQRVVDGLPFSCGVLFFEITSRSTQAEDTRKLQRLVKNSEADVVIAYGSSYALSLAGACVSTSSRLAANKNNSGIHRHTFAIPGIDGVPSLALPRNPGARSGPIFYGSGVQPSAVIIDPTLIAGASIKSKASAVAKTIARCLSAQFSAGFNPPAEGIALDGFKRVARNLNEVVSEDSLEMRRELMAASLNATLAMPSKAGIAHELCDILLNHTGAPIDEGALVRLLIVVEAEILESSWTERRIKSVRTALEVPHEQPLRQWLISLLEELPLPGSFLELGVNVKQLHSAADEMAASNASIIPSASQLFDTMTGLELLSRETCH